MTQDYRLVRLNNHFTNVINSKSAPMVSQKDLFLEAICAQNDPQRCISDLIAHPVALKFVGTCMHADLNIHFLNGRAANLLSYLRNDAIAAVDNAGYLRQVLQVIVAPPIFWAAFCNAFSEKRLESVAEESFAWLLSCLVSLPNDQATLYRQEAELKYLHLLEKSQNVTIRQFGNKIKNILSATAVAPSFLPGSNPGGRHDNDWSDFRKISILPTCDEIGSSNPPFLRPAIAIDDPDTKDSRVPIYLDNQFRLLREDMLSELREELKAVFGNTKKHNRTFIIKGLDPIDIFVNTDTRRPHKWGVKLRLSHDLPHFKNTKPQDRRNFVNEKRWLLPHGSLTCLLVDDQIVAFPIVHRDEDLLAKQPPIIVLQFENEISTKDSLLKLKGARSSVTLVSVDVGVFSYEPILNAIKETTTLPLAEEILYWEEGAELKRPRFFPEFIIDAIQANPKQNIQVLLDTPKPIILGTGKSFIGALLAKAIYKFTQQRILVVCYTNHALDQFLEDLLDIGIPESSLVRLGGKSTQRTANLALRQQNAGFTFRQPDWTIIDALKKSLQDNADDLMKTFQGYKHSWVQYTDILNFLEFEDPEYYEAFSIPKTSSDGMVIVGRKGQALSPTYLLDNWAHGRGAGFLFKYKRKFARVWDMPPPIRQEKIAAWNRQILEETVVNLINSGKQFNSCQEQLLRKFSEKDVSVLKEKRIIGCTTTAAAKYTDIINAAAADVLLVEEAGEILESHILTALGRSKDQLILIGDHKQLRPKVNNYLLTVEKGEGYDLNVSLFERLVLKGYPHTTLTEQHRMRPEISALVRELTYPELQDASGTRRRANLRGVRDNIVFISHACPEDENTNLGQRPEENYGAKSSKQNTHEVKMVLKAVRYLGQQGYGTDDIVILTPYLGQLQNMMSALKEDSDPVLSDLDSHDLIKAGLINPATADVKKHRIRMATIDNYQGEESDIVIVSLTRSNPGNNIGFMFSPERLNVLLSRARNALIMIGNADTFKKSRKGGKLWSKLFGLLAAGNHVYEGLPVRCERHLDQTAILKEPEEFDIECPDGGCKRPCGTKLSCGIHECPSRCHQLYDHSKMRCGYPMTSICPNGHKQPYSCHQGPPPVCKKCRKQQEEAKRKLEEEMQRKLKRDAEQLKHDKNMADLEAQIKAERVAIADAQLAEERARALREKKQPPTPDGSSPSVPGSAAPSQSSTRTPILIPKLITRLPNLNPLQPSPPPDSSISHSLPQPFVPKKSQCEAEWERQKLAEGACNDAIDALMAMTALEEVKEKVLEIKDKIDVASRQGASLKGERFNAVLLGNPGTGKTTVARLYAKFLASVGVLSNNEFFETTGSRLGNDGVSSIEKKINDLVQDGGGTIFVDEAYQLTSGHNYQGKQVLDFLLAEMENKADKIVFLFAGYTKEMEKFFEHNPGLDSRVPYKLQFAGYKDEELLKMFVGFIASKWKGKMNVKDGALGLYSRIAARRVGKGRGQAGFGNARAVQNMLARVAGQQARRIQEERKNGKTVDHFLLTKEDLIGPDPSKVMKESEAWKKLQQFVGLDEVKKSVEQLFAVVGTNYKRELLEQKPLDFSLNRAFVGSPGTGKTSVAQLYGEILRDLGILSNGEVVVKNPADFIGSVLGESESKTKAILATTVGKVLVIDEAYMLYTGTGGTGKHSDSFKTAVIDTLVAEVQSTPGEDRCVLLLGYTQQIEDMFQNVNPGLSRRFDIENAFRFLDYNDDQLLEILNRKLKAQDLNATNEAKKAAIDYLSRARNRPNFGNAGEVENILSKAKVRCQSRTSDGQIVLQPSDFDPDYDRRENAASNLVKLFEGVVGAEDIIAKLGSYQQIARKMVNIGKDPRDKIPMNFIFKGPPGTGKTTTARKMGQVFYDMGLLSSKDVKECTASDLVGQFVGQTGPKTLKVFEQTLGRVLFIDEAYRLAEGLFAQEAMDELVGILTNEKFRGKMVVILAGYDHDINRLMQVNSGLTSRFPETIFFRNMSPHKCLEVLAADLKKEQIFVPALHDKTSKVVPPEMIHLVEELSKLPSWGNARDMKTLATQMTRITLERETDLVPGVDMVLPDEAVLGCMRTMLAERKEREANVPPRSRNLRSGSPPSPRMQFATDEQRLPEIKTSTAQRAATKPPPPKVTPPPLKAKKAGNGKVAPNQRDPGVSDSIWAELQHAIETSQREEVRIKNELNLKEQIVQQAQREEEKRQQKLKALEDEMKRKRRAEEDEAAMQELKRKMEEARLHKLRAKQERERKAAELEARKKEEQRKREEEAKVQTKLRRMGVCPVGYQWIATGGGYRCAGGSHYVTNGQLGL